MHRAALASTAAVVRRPAAAAAPTRAFGAWKGPCVWWYRRGWKEAAADAIDDGWWIVCALASSHTLDPTPQPPPQHPQPRPPPAAASPARPPSPRSRSSSPAPPASPPRCVHTRPPSSCINRACCGIHRDPTTTATHIDPHSFNPTHQLQTTNPTGLPRHGRRHARRLAGGVARPPPNRGGRCVRVVTAPIRMIS